jgi:hypothetical protein
MVTEMEWKEVWQIEYRGIRSEVVHWDMKGRPCWNYYLTVPVVKLPAELRRVFDLTPYYEFPESTRFISYDYGNAPIIAELDWHSGISWYKRIFDDFGILSGIELGCDYQHMWEKDFAYTFERVYDDMKHSIDKLLELVPSLIVNCQAIEIGAEYDSPK